MSMTRCYRSLFCCLALIAPAWACESGEGGEKDRGESFIASFIERADLDGDGAVSLEEFLQLDRLQRLPEEKRREIFERLDKDDDGLLHKQELKELRPERGRPPYPRMEHLDTNGDGGVDFEEFSASSFVQRLPEDRRREFFDRLDRDGDGRITPLDHPEQGRRGGREGGRRGGQPDLDRDGNGVIDFEEFQRLPWIRELAKAEQEDRFKALDKNGDLKLDESELPKPEPHSHHKDRGGPPRDRR